MILFLQPSDFDLQLLQLNPHALVARLHRGHPVPVHLDPRLVLLDLELAAVDLEVLVREVALQVRLVPLEGLDVLLVHLYAVQFQVFKLELTLTLGLGERVTLAFHEVEL